MLQQAEQLAIRSYWPGFKIVLNSKTNSPVLLVRLYLHIETVSCGLLLLVAKLDTDWPLFFQVLMLCMQKLQKNIMVSA